MVASFSGWSLLASLNEHLNNQGITFMRQSVGTSIAEPRLICSQSTLPAQQIFQAYDQYSSWITFLAFGCPCFAPDEHLSSKQQDDGVSMSFPDKSDVKSRLSRRVRILAFSPFTESDSIGSTIGEQKFSLTRNPSASLPHDGNSVAAPVIRKLPA